MDYTLRTYITVPMDFRFVGIKASISATYGFKEFVLICLQVSQKEYNLILVCY